MATLASEDDIDIRLESQRLETDQRDTRNERDEQDRRVTRTIGSSADGRDTELGRRAREVIELSHRDRQLPTKRVERRLTTLITGIVVCLLLALAFNHTQPAQRTRPATSPTVSITAASGGAEQGGQKVSPIPPGLQTSSPVHNVTQKSPAALVPPTPAANTAPHAGGDGFSLDPKDWVIAALGAAFNWIFSNLSNAFTSLIKQALDLDFLVLTPPGDTYQNTVVLGFWKALVGIADAALAVIACWAGYNSMVRDQIGARYHNAMQVLPRLALGALAVNLSLLFSQTLIDLNNALCSVVSGPFTKILDLLQLNVASGVALVILLLAFGVVTLFLVAQMIVRLAMLDLLIVTAPLGLVCWVLPQTQAWARLWTRTFLSTVFVQFLQILTLALGGAFLAFFPNDGLFGAFMDLLIGLAVCYAALKIPGLLRGLGGSSAPNPLSDAVGIAGTALLVSRLAALSAA